MIFGEGPIIKNIAGDLNKLFLQGSRAGQPVNVEGSAAANQGTAALMAARDPVIQEISVGMSGEQSARYTVSGTPPLSLPNSLGKPLKAWEVDVSPYQEGTGDPSPDNVRPIHGTDKLNLFVEESYDPSATPKAVLTLPQTVYTGTIGSEGGESRSAEVILDGTQTGINVNWRPSATSVGVLFPYSLTNNKLAPVAGIPNVIADTMPTKTYDDAYHGRFDNGITVVAISTAWGLCIRLPDPTLTTAALVNQYLAQHPITVVYELATPTTFAVPSPPIPTPTGTATTWATAEDGTVESMEVTYVGKA